MDLSGKKVILHDMSLRDGMHAKQHQITVDQMVVVDQLGGKIRLPSISKRAVSSGAGNLT